MFAYLKNFECQSKVKKSFNFRFLILILIFNFQQYLFGEDPPLWYLQTLSKFTFFFVFIQKISLIYLEWLKFLTFGGHVWGGPQFWYFQTLLCYNDLFIFKPILKVLWLYLVWVVKNLKFWRARLRANPIVLPKILLGLFYF